MTKKITLIVFTVMAAAALHASYVVSNRSFDEKAKVAEGASETPCTPTPSPTTPPSGE